MSKGLDDCALPACCLQDTSLSLSGWFHPLNAASWQLFHGSGWSNISGSPVQYRFHTFTASLNSLSGSPLMDSATHLASVTPLNIRWKFHNPYTLVFFHDTKTMWTIPPNLASHLGLEPGPLVSYLQKLFLVIILQGYNISWAFCFFRLLECLGEVFPWGHFSLYNNAGQASSCSPFF